jgi:hypothetical protein
MTGKDANPVKVVIVAFSSRQCPRDAIDIGETARQRAPGALPIQLLGRKSYFSRRTLRRQASRTRLRSPLNSDDFDGAPFVWSLSQLLV